MSHHGNDSYLDHVRDNVRDGETVERCTGCGAQALVFNYHLREPVPGDEGDVYTVGESWICYVCGQTEDRLD